MLRSTPRGVHARESCCDATRGYESRRCGQARIVEWPDMASVLSPDVFRDSEASSFSSLLGVDHSCLVGEDDRLGTVAEVELCVDTFHVRFNGALAQE